MKEHFFKFSLLSHFPEVIHGISNRSYGEMRFSKVSKSEVVRNRQAFLEDLGIDIREIVVPRQVHGSKIVIVGASEAGKGAKEKDSAILGVDGLVATESGVFLSILTADCLPIMFYDPVNQIAGICHAGWRGIVDQIIFKMVDKFKNLGTRPEDLIIGIGPGICQKHFVVKNEVLKYFLSLYSAATFVRNNDGYVDLKKAAAMDLKKAGVSSGNIEISHSCTVCDNGIYPSFRKEKDKTIEIISVIGMR